MEKILLTPPNGWFIVAHWPSSFRLYNFAGALIGSVEPTPLHPKSEVSIYGVGVENGVVVETFSHHSFHFLDEEAYLNAFDSVKKLIKSRYEANRDFL